MTNSTSVSVNSAPVLEFVTRARPYSAKRMAQQLCLLLGVAMLPFDDLRIPGGVGGGMLASPAWVPFAVLGAAHLRTTGFRAGVPRAVKELAALAFYGLTISVVALLVSSDLSGRPDALSKTANNFIIFLVFALVIVGAFSVSHLRATWILGVLAAFVFLAVTSLLQSIVPGFLDGLGPLHRTPNVQVRVRATRFEASSLGSLLLILIGMFWALSKRKSAIWQGTVLVIVAQSVTQSRGTLLVSGLLSLLALVMLILAPLNRRQHARVPVLLAMASVPMIASFYLSSVLSASFWRDLGLVAANSDAMRGLWARAMGVSLIEHPFGLGFAEYLVQAPKLLLENAGDVSAVYGYSAVAAEMSPIVAGETDTLSPKTLPTIAAMYFGWLGVLFTFRLYYSLFKASWKQASYEPSRLLAAVALVAVSASYFSSLFAWEQALLIGLLLSPPVPPCDDRLDSVE